VYEKLKMICEAEVGSHAQGRKYDYCSVMATVTTNDGHFEAVLQTFFHGTTLSSSSNGLPFEHLAHEEFSRP
jgi:hypothetical protein